MTQDETPGGTHTSNATKESGQAGSTGVRTEWVGLVSPTGRRDGAGGSSCQGVYWAPSGNRPKVAFLASHYEVDFCEHYLGELLARRGFGFLGWNTRYRAQGAWFSFDRAMDDIATGARWLLEQAKAEAIVLLGNSGGASLMGAYQHEALAFQDRAGERLGGDCPPAELFVSLNAHQGRPQVLTSWLDGSVVDEGNLFLSDPDLDPFSPERKPPFEESFVARYRQAQQARNERITTWAEAKLRALRAAGGYDELFSVKRTWADLRFLDISLDPSHREPGCYAGDPKVANLLPIGLASTCTLGTWLEMWSLRSERARAETHLREISQPALVIQSLGDQGCFPSDAQAIFEALASTDKSLVWMEGDHYLQQPRGAREQAADIIEGWVKERLG